MGKLEIVTFGCRLNAYESEVMRARLGDTALEDAIIFNTCAVTGEATRQARQAIRRARRENPKARIVVTGCAAQTEPAVFAEMPEVDLVLGNQEKFEPANYRPPAFGLNNEERVKVNDIMAVRETALHMLDGFAERTRAFVQIQNGCDHRCTFCIIPFGRGNSRSAPAGEVVEQIRRLVAGGYSEIVLSGVDITAWGGDLPGRPSLGGLVRRILKSVKDLRRLRLSSIDSAEADDDLKRAMAEEERLMPHLHLSLQSGDDLILKRMKRRHLSAQSIAFCHELRQLRPDIALGADIIAGFPTEDETMFNHSLDLVDECGLTFLHVFPFSPRPGTTAARMPQVAKSVIHDRARRLREKGKAKFDAFLSAELGSRRSILVETDATGRTEHFAPVRFAQRLTPGAVVSATVVGRGSDHLEVRLAA
jgi:threonylcarbamoyladenosine tRNA methylthiotransferase MtaB